MTGRKIIEAICQELACSAERTWHHKTYGHVASQGDQGVLAQFLYYFYYLGAPGLYDVQDNAPSTLMMDKEDPTLAALFLSSLKPQVYQDPGWRIVEQTDDVCIAEKNGVQLALKPDDWIKGTDKQDYVTVLMPRARRYASPGYFAVCSDKGPLPGSTPTDRVYVNVGKENAADAFRMLLDWASSHNIPGIVKAANHEAGYNRPDTVVGYFPRSPFRNHMAELIETLSGVKLRARSPAFTNQLISGLSWAEDPGRKVSFGMDRCNLIARALVSTSHGQTALELEQTILAAWKDAGLNITKPHLNVAR